jgi:hypothetical protein
MPDKRNIKLLIYVLSRGWAVQRCLNLGQSSSSSVRFSLSIPVRTDGTNGYVSFLLNRSWALFRSAGTDHPGFFMVCSEMTLRPERLLTMVVGFDIKGDDQLP